jgi:DNA-binding transcriptional ArsR family regulator
VLGDAAAGPKALTQARLALQHRQRILLMFEPGEQLNVGQIVGTSTLSRSALSHHLRVLRDAGVLKSEKVGKEVQFWTDAPAERAALTAVEDYLASHH